jgi:hypothetical protein
MAATRTFDPSGSLNVTSVHDELVAVSVLPHASSDPD